ncbi:peptidoglycan DD-metalloendopeptidase family protein [Clostridium kluyveri]|uniref:peptidoglycan DD-metalloendopeptidase family protein n=1 Tax=Clostridium kluyveri TaxID=1534 RepID=UPI002247A385|nr:M23 family metallopeptidase [Clostridium kluyveri]UZQ48897.1 M23 family metallopeptidase [Clostridium kluyveri]
MFKRKNLVYSAVVILATALTVTSLVVTNRKESADEPINNVVLAEQVKEKAELDTSSQEDVITADVENPPTNSAVTNKIKINTYTVTAGDSLESIATAYNIKVNIIAESNKLSLNATLTEGQVLEFPSIDGVLYKVQSGETLWDLALLNKVDFNRIVEINELEAPEKLKLGQKIIIPGVDKVKPLASNTTTSTKKNSASNKTLSRGGSIPTIISASLPVQGKLSSKYGPRWGRQHAGIDIAAPTGTDVFASMDGKVTFSGWDDGGYGNLVIIDHGNGLQSYYAHNSKLLVEKGEYVNKGTQIADVGNTGNSTGPHSHFEIRKNGSPVNPYTYIK